MRLNNYGQTEIDPEEKPERSYKKYLIAFILFVVFVAIVCGLCGCADVEAWDKDFYIHTRTVGKDIIVDPNGVMSTVSPEDTGILEAIAGFLIGLFVG